MPPVSSTPVSTSPTTRLVCTASSTAYPFRRAVDGTSQHRCRTHQKNRRLVRVVADEVANELVGGVRVVKLCTGKVGPTQAPGSVQRRLIHIVLDRQGRAEARPAGRVGLF